MPQDKVQEPAESHMGHSGHQKVTPRAEEGEGPHQTIDEYWAATRGPDSSFFIAGGHDE